MRTPSVLVLLLFAGCASTKRPHPAVVSPKQAQVAYSCALDGLARLGYNIQSSNPLTGVIHAERPVSSGEPGVYLRIHVVSDAAGLRVTSGFRDAGGSIDLYGKGGPELKSDAHAIGTECGAGEPTYIGPIQ